MSKKTEKEKNTTAIKISLEVKDFLNEVGNKIDTYDSILRRELRGFEGWKNAKENNKTMG
jgi:hypothetical protein